MKFTSRIVLTTCSEWQISPWLNARERRHGMMCDLKLCHFCSFSLISFALLCFFFYVPFELYKLLYFWMGNEWRNGWIADRMVYFQIYVPVACTAFFFSWSLLFFLRCIFITLFQTIFHLSVVPFGGSGWHFVSFLDFMRLIVRTSIRIYGL